MTDGGLVTNNHTVVSAFHTALVHQALIVLAIAFVVTVLANVVRAAQLKRRGAAPTAARSDREAPGRRLLRIGFGSLWILDGILQVQSAMPLGMISQVVQPAETGSPGWVHQLLSGPISVWDYHPVTAAAATVWIQVGIGLWLVVAPRGWWSRLGGLASVAWGLLVWVFGEAFGGIFAPGLSWLTGAPGGVLLYVAAGVLLVLPEGWWRSARVGRSTLGVVGAFFVGMAVLQAWPGRGYWVGTIHGMPNGSLTQMVAQMAQTSQPRLFERWVASFASFDAAHGFAVNLFVVLALAFVGAGLLTGRRRVAGVAVAAGVVLCLADWVLVQDFGFFGGVGTDPNSMVPIALLLVGGYLAMVRPASTPSTSVVPIDSARPTTPQRRFALEPASVTVSAVLALGALAVTLVGAAPMASAAISSHADPILAEAADGPAEAVDYPAGGFRLVDASGQPVTLSSMRGDTVVLTFLDDTCTSDCPLIAQELRIADGYLGAASHHVELVAINANPRFIAPAYLAAFDQQEGLDGVGNWRYLTGTLPELRAVWKAYGEAVVDEPAGAMVGHSEYVWIIDPAGRVRAELNSNPGAGDGASESSFAALVASTVRRVAGE